MRYTVRKSVVWIVGKIWIPMVTCSQTIELRAYDIENIRAHDDDGNITRDAVEQWLYTHAGDFSSIQDFSASIEDGDTTIDIPWATEDGEIAYDDTLAGMEY